MSDIWASPIADNFLSILYRFVKYTLSVNFISIFYDYFHNISRLTVVINLNLPFSVCFKQT